MVAQQDGAKWQAPTRDAAAKPGTDPLRRTAQGISALKTGAEAFLWQAPRALPGPDAVSRARARHELRSGRHRLPPEMADAVGISTGLHAPRSQTPSTIGAPPQPLHLAETPDAVAQLCAGEVWGEKNIDYTGCKVKESGGKRHDLAFQGGDIVDELLFGHDTDHSHTKSEARQHGLVDDFGHNCVEMNIPDDSANADDFRMLTSQVQRFLARARGRGVRGIPKVLEAFESVSINGLLDLTAFTKIAMDLGLCRSCFECRCAYRFFAEHPERTLRGVPLVSSGLLPYDFFLMKFREPLPAKRAAIIRDVWCRFDPEDTGAVEMRDLMAVFDARYLPYVKNGEVNIDEAVREFVEAFDASGSLIPVPEKASFALSEAVARRRPQLTGGRSTPLESAAGRPSNPDRPSIPESRRAEGDYLRELSARRPEVDLSKRISAQDFEAYYACISMAIQDDMAFAEVARGPWTAAKIHEEAMLLRHRHERRRQKEHVPASFRILAIFKDGSRKILPFRNDIDLQEVTQAASGIHCNQMWTWGPNVQEEVKKRLEADGYHGISFVRLAP